MPVEHHGRHRVDVDLMVARLRPLVIAAYKAGGGGRRADAIFADHLGHRFWCSYVQRNH